MTTIPLKMCLFFCLLAPFATHAQKKSRTEKPIPGLTKLVYHVKDDNTKIKEGDFEESLVDIPLTQGYYINDQKNGGWKYLSPDNMVTFTGNYYNDHKVNRWYYIHEQKVFSVLSFNAEGQLHGDAIGLYATGDTAAVTPFSNGKRQGIALRFDQHHQITAKKYFDNNQLLADTSFYANGRIHRIHTYQDGKIMAAVTMDSLGNMLPSPTSDKEPRDTENEEGYYMPTFPGGLQTLQLFLSKAVQYPPEAIRRKVEGKVVVSFVIDADGYIKNINVKESIDPVLDEEAKRVTALMPRWSPGIQDFLPVSVQFNLPISFKIP